MKFVPKVQINHIRALIQIMAWRRPVTSHYLIQWWLVFRRIYVSLRLNELTHWGPEKMATILQMRFQKLILTNENVCILIAFPLKFYS